MKQFYAQAAKPQLTAASQKSYTVSLPPRALTASLPANSLTQTIQPLSTRKTLRFQIVRSVSSAQKARDLNQQGIDEQVSSFDSALAQEKDKQHAAPWHREGAETPPVHRQRSAGAMTKGMKPDWFRCPIRLTYPGKLLTTPARLLKLVLPLTTTDHNTGITPVVIMGFDTGC